MRAPSIVAENLSKNYGNTEALKKVNFSIAGKGLLIIYGPNGSGKSTLLRLISGIEKPSGGSILVNGAIPWMNLDYTSRILVLIAEGTWLPSYYTGFELARMLSKARRVPIENIRDYADLLGVSRYWRKPIATYSMGMRKRLLLLLGFSLSGDVDIILFDEPYTLLDANTRRLVSQLLLRLSRSKLIVVATHILTSAEERAREAIVLVNGEVKTIIKRESSPSVVCEYNLEILQKLAERNIPFSYDPQNAKIIIYSWEGRLPENCERGITSLILEKLIK